jgi:isopentenyl-diphosphate delta-isomerase
MSDASANDRRRVVTCDHDGVPIGTAGVFRAHEGEGILHKAFSIFIFRNAGTELLLQRRSPHKRLFALRWANSCCSHPSPADTLLADSAERRLREELGFSVPLREAGSFVYRAKDPNTDSSEYEHDTVLVGNAAGISIKPNPAEIAEWRWAPVVDLQRDLRENAGRYAPWLAPALPIALAAR